MMGAGRVEDKDREKARDARPPQRVGSSRRSRWAVRIPALRAAFAPAGSPALSWVLSLREIPRQNEIRRLQMELRRADPRILKANANNPRKIQPGELSDAALAASIKAVGILQPPAATEKSGDLTIAYGARRVRIAIQIGLPEIDILVKDPDESDQMRAVSENVVRAPMATVDLWRSIESLASENWTEEAIASALAIPVRQIRKLRLLAAVHPTILDQIGVGDMPKESELRTIASAPREEQAAVWKQFKPEKGEAVIWWRLSQALDKTRFFARDAKFGEDERAAFGIIWQEDLFAEGDEDNRFTIDGEAFVSAQRAWLDAHMPKNGALLDVDEYGREKLPPKAQRTWTKPKRGDHIGFAIHPRDGTLHEVVFRMPEPEAKKGKTRSTDGDSNEALTPKKTRPEITHKGDEIIGALRTEALVKSLEVNAADDATLIGLLILALNARNVSIQTHGSGRATRTKLVQSITEGGRLSHDVERLRVVARQTLADVLSCSLGHGDSGLPARIAGDAIGADAHLGNMATEDFLSCLSKTAIERVGSSLNVQPRQRVKDTRAAVIAEAAGSTYIHPAALFALSQAEIAHHSDAARDYSSGYSDSDDSSDETTEEVDGAPGAEDNSLEPEPDHGLDSMDSDENAHLDDEDPPIVRKRTRAPRRHAAAE
jgi:ParB family transcriptional regulator, chromosome partitioning protein